MKTGSMPKLLETISGPADLKKLTVDELEGLCAEIREVLIDTVTSNGGHLASNLGVVELTVALHRVFDSPRDKIIWDVGHQSYVHKLLTGRWQRFGSLRQYDGLSGFADPAESSHDPFISGHASTSISAGLGMAIARDLCGNEHNVVAVIGDGSLTGGMAYEAINHAGYLGTKLIVVLNDNGMSISPTVGALVRQLNRVRFSHHFREAQAGVSRLLTSSPWGKKFGWVLHRFKQGAKAVVLPTMFWEELGFTYIGPIDGHNIPAIETALGQAKSCSGPVLVHIVTVKGKGYKPAEAAPEDFHSLPPKGDNLKTVQTYSQVFAETILELARCDPRVVVITAAMTKGNCLGIFASEFPHRFYDVGICEQHAVTMAAGLATQGFVPVVAIYSTFLQRCFDQILHDVCLQNLPVVFVLDRSGIVGDDGKTHQGIFDLSYLRLMPNMVVSAPKDENELRDLLYTAVHTNSPMAIRYPRDAVVGAACTTGFQSLPVGKGEVLQTGEDIAIMAIGSTVWPSVEAAYKLREAGINATVVNARFAKPLDSTLLTEVAAQVGKVITVEENTLSGGFGSAVVELLVTAGISNVRVRRIGIPDQFVEHGPQSLLRSKYRLDATGIAETAMSFLAELPQSTIGRQRR